MKCIKLEEIMKKLLISKCQQCPKMVFYNGWGYYCGGINLPNEKDRKIPDPRVIPDWCILENEV
jgi:hypothetical protein